MDLKVKVDPSGADVAEALILVTTEQLRSLALFAPEPADNNVWLAFEFFGRAVTGRDVDTAALHNEGWTPEPRQDYVVWTPPSLAQVSRAQFARELFGRRPYTVTVDANCDLDDASLFGDLVSPRRGGSSALMALSSASPNAESVLLRNPAALELDIIVSRDSLCHLAERGAIRVASVGTGSRTSVSHLDLDEFADPDAARRHWRDHGRPGHAFWLIIQIEAVVHPPVGIPPGHIFEQLSVNGVQTLAVATRQAHVVNPGRPLTTVVPAWCLNQELNPPSGQRLRVTPLRARYADGQSQSQVWADRARVLALVLIHQGVMVAGIVICLFMG